MALHVQATVSAALFGCTVLLLAVVIQGATAAAAQRATTSTTPNLFFMHGAARRHLLQESSAADASIDAGIVGDRHYLHLNSTQIRGSYIALGENYPENIWSSFFTGEFPNCNNNKSIVNWEHNGVTDRSVLTISGHTEEDAGYFVEAHHRGTYGARLLSYNNSILELVEISEGEKFCAHWQPYVDTLTGELMVSAVVIALWERAEDTYKYTDLSCSYAAGNEKPGCYLADIARYPATPEIEAKGAAFDQADAIANRQKGSVISIAVAKFLCLNGECAGFSPKWARIDAEHDE